MRASTFSIVPGNTTAAKAKNGSAAPLHGKRDKVVLMTKVCTHGRDKTVGMQQLEQSLTRLRTDHLDVWQIHEVIYYNDPDLIFAPTASSKRSLRPSSRARFASWDSPATKIPQIHLKMLAHNYPFDTVQMPLNLSRCNLPQLSDAGAAGSWFVAGSLCSA